MAGMDQAATTLASEVVVPTGRVLCTCICSMIKDIVKFQSNLDVLEKKMEDLLAVQDQVKYETELAEKEGKNVKPLVTKWLKDVEELQVEVNNIQAEKLSPRSLNCIKRYRISRKVAKKLKDIEELRKAGSSHSGAVAFNHSRPKTVQIIPGPTIQDQTTSSKTLAEIMTKLYDKKVRRLGIWGLGGVGKTTLVRTLNNKLENISSMESFGIVIWVTISQNLDMKKVQTQIAQRLNLEAKKEESLEQMAIRLNERLRKEEKFLLILDDVWHEIDLDKLGVPQDENHRGSKILLTTRSKSVCGNMVTDYVVEVEGFKDEEAWQLFCEKAGHDLVTSQSIKPIAEAIAKRCCGLPLAIITMGTSMRGKKTVDQWKLALNELQRSVPCEVRVEEKLYRPLKWSYDSLEGKNIKPCFLYCSLFPEDFSIENFELVQHWLAEGLIGEQENYVDSVTRGIALIENLKDSCLLEDGAHKNAVKMHDVVRDVAIWIASSPEDGCKSLIRSGIGLSEMSSSELSDNSFKRVSFMNNKIVRLPDCVVQCSDTSTLLLQRNSDIDIVPEKFLQGFEALKVLNMSSTRICSLPFSLIQLGELRALFLRNCKFLKELPPLEGLSRLQVLDLYATSIRELPRGIENLNNLKQLNLSCTRHLKSIQGGIISQLSCLEVLDMKRCNYCFEMKGDVPEYMACFEELKCIERLCVLHIKFKRIPNFSNEDLSFINRLKQFHFFISENERFVTYAGYYNEPRSGERAVTFESIDLPSEEVLIGPLLSTANDLLLDYCVGLNDMLECLVNNSVDCFAGLKYLTIRSGRGSVWQGGCIAQHDLLPNLEELHLRGLNYGKSILEVLGHLGSRFPSLKLIQVTSCSTMEYLLSCGHFIHALPNLEVIKVKFCRRLGELFVYDSVQNMVQGPVVPSLRILELELLPELRTLCRDEEIWPRLEQVRVVKCNLVRKLPLTDQNAENMKEIKGESQWWNTLKWHADTTKSSLMPYFHPI